MRGNRYISKPIETTKKIMVFFRHQGLQCGAKHILFYFPLEDKGHLKSIIIPAEI